MPMSKFFPELMPDRGTAWELSSTILSTPTLTPAVKPVQRTGQDFCGNKCGRQPEARAEGKGWNMGQPR